MKNFKPMLADKAPEDLGALNFPVLVSPKLDGIRCVIIDGKPVSRKLKDIPNEYIQRVLTDAKLPEGFDGELMMREQASFSETSGNVMRRDGEPDFVFNVFDCATAPGGFQERFAYVEGYLKRNPTQFATVVPHRLVQSASELLRIEECALSDGFEGAMIRSLDGPYKMGRATTKQGYLLKLKRFADDEAVVCGVAELMHNMNEATKDNLGRTKRSSAKAGKEGGDTLGKLLCKRVSDDCPVDVGGGFTAAQRAELWAVRDTLIGKIVKYKFQPDPAAPQNAPRFPVFLGFRDAADMD